jgi:O-glycosyl hydrolase
MVLLAVLVFQTVGAATVTLDGGVTNQVIDGFGVNANFRSWNNDELKPVIDALVDQAGMTLFRVVYDEANWETNNDNSDPDVMNWGYYAPLYHNAEFTKLWDLVGYLNGKGITTNGVIFNFMGPGPAWMGGGSLTAGMESEWAEMITSLLVWARYTNGLQFAYVGPDNEPDIANEGITISSASQYVTALRALAQKLDANNLSDLRFVAPDLAGGGTTYMPQMLADAVVMGKLGHFGVHSYSDGGSGSSGVYAYLQASAYPDRTFWVTEFNVWCSTCGSGTRGTYDWSYCKGTAEYLMQHLLNNASGGIVWEGYDSYYLHPPTAWSFWGLFSVDNENVTPKTYTPRKNFYTLAQISKFVRPGAQRIGVSGSVASLSPLLAFKHTGLGQITIVGINTSGSAATLSGALASLPTVTHLDLYYTSATTNLADGGSAAVNNGTFSATIPPDCVFTLTGFTGVNVALTNPVNGAQFNAPAAIPLAATATTTEGSIALVGFYNGASELAEATSAPYGFTWDNVPMGNYALTAVARDTLSNIGTSAMVNVTVVGPLAQIGVAPANATVAPGGKQQFSATGADLLGHALVPQPAFVWSVSGGGTIDGTGLFTAGSAADGPFNVTAVSGGITGMSSVSVVAASGAKIGNTEEGTSTDPMWSNGAWINAGRFQAASNIVVSTMRAKVGAISGGYKCAIYADKGGSPSALLGGTAEVRNPGNGWNSFPFASSLALTNGQYYWLAIWSDNASAKVYYSDTSGTQRWGQYNYGAWPDPITTSGGGNFNCCIFATGVAAPLTIGTTSLSNGVVNVAYSTALAASGGTLPYNWSIASGSLPSGLMLNAGDGVITGSPTGAGAFNFTVQVSDASSPIQSATKPLSLAVASPPSVVTIWPSTAVPGLVDGGPDNAAELGVKFQSDVAGTITGIRFYKAAANTGAHVGNLWTSTGTRLATAAFSGETASGWQQVLFAAPVAITSNTVYVASYHCTGGHYSADLNYFASKGAHNPPLQALTNGVSDGNGVYAYGTSSAFPSLTWNAVNYWVDVVFELPVLTVTADSGQAKVYGQADPILTYQASGFLGSDTAGSVLTGTLGRASGETVGTYAINQGSLSAGGKYAISFVPANFAITPAQLTVTANDASKRCGATLTFAGSEFTTSGLVSPDTVTSVTLTSVGAAAAAAVSPPTYPITPSAAVGSGLNNYTINYVNGTLTVNPAVLTVTADSGQTKVYGQADPTLTYQASGFIGGDTAATVLTGTLGRAVGETVGGYAINQGSLSADGKYTISFVSANFAITPAQLTVTAKDASKVYGTTLTFAGTEFRTSTLVSPDTVTSVTLTSVGAAATAAVSPPTYPITPSSAVGSGLDNYTINYVNGTLTVNPAVVAVNGTVAYYPTSYPSGDLSGKPVENVTMSLTGDTSQSAVTTGNGSYGLNNIPVGGTYCVTPSKTDDSPTANGVDVMDLIAIARHITGERFLDSPYKLLAADVNADGSIDVGDLIAVQGLILGIADSLPAGLWRFVPTDYEFPDLANPWGAPSSRSYNNLGADVTDGDFVAIKLGDVDNSWPDPAAGQSLPAKRVKMPAKGTQGSQGLVRGALPEVVFGVSQGSAQPGQRVIVGVRVSGFSQVCGAQFTLAWDPAVLRYVGTGSYGARELSAACFGTTLTESGKLTFAWYDPEAVGVTLADGTALFTVSFEVIGKAGSVSGVALTGSPTAQAVCVDVARVAFGAQDGNVSVVGPGVPVSNSVYAKGVFRLSVATEQGRSYTLEFTDSLTPANWTALPAVTGDGTVNVLVDPAATYEQRLYRVRVQ